MVAVRSLLVLKFLLQAAVLVCAYHHLYWKSLPNPTLQLDNSVRNDW